MPNGFPRPVELFLQVLIVYSVFSIALETLPGMRAWSGFFYFSEAVVVGVFTLEYFGRWWKSEDPKTYPFTPMALIDAVAIAPFYLALFVDLRFLRLLRLLRLFRLLKLGRYSVAMKLLAEAFRRAWHELSAFAFVGMLIIFIAAFALYYAEFEAQPEVFSSVPAALWWSVVTLTTVGYGDVYPVTPMGRMVAGVTMIVGIGFIAVPASILSSTMTTLLHERLAREEAAREATAARKGGRRGGRPRP